jgi:cell wall-associated NlpC family hydrolase
VPPLTGARRPAGIVVAVVTLTSLIVTAVFVAGAPAHAAPADPDLAELDQQIVAATDRLEVLVEQRNAVRDDLAATQARASDTAARLARDTTRMEDLRDRAGAIAASAYRTGPASQVSALLAAGSPGAIVDQLTALEGLGLQARGRLSGMADLLTSLRRQRDDLSALSQRQYEQATKLAELTAQVERDLGELRRMRSRTVAAQHLVAAPPRPLVAGAAGAAVAYAYAQIGKPYLYGAAGPAAFDCSGLTKAAWAAAGVTLPHNAARQYSSMPHLTRADLAPGDLVFYYGDVHHVAIYIGNGMVIHAPQTGDAVRAAGMDMAPIHGYGRP